MGKPRIGNRKHAFDALNDDTMSADWYTFHAGSIRNTYLHKPTRVVYKVDGWFEDNYSNHGELRNLRALSRIDWNTRIRIPVFSAFRFDTSLVIAMEYIEGSLGKDTPSADFLGDERREFFDRARFSDMHGENWIASVDGYFVPIDLGCDRILNGDGEVDDRVLSAHGGRYW